VNKDEYKIPIID